MEQYVHNVKLQHWIKLIEDANTSCLSRHEWLEANGITKDAFYYWQRKVRRYYAEQYGMIPSSAGDGKGYGVVEVPIATSTPKALVTYENETVTAATVHIGNMTIEINSAATSEFMESLGRMIKNAI